MGVELVAEVVLDAQRLPAGEDPASIHEATADEPSPMIAAISNATTRMSGSPSSSLMTTPIRTGTRMPATCEPIASTEETISDARYGRRKPRRRTNVRQPWWGLLRGSSSGTAS